MAAVPSGLRLLLAEFGWLDLAHGVSAYEKADARQWLGERVQSTQTGLSIFTCLESDASTILRSRRIAGRVN